MTSSRATKPLPDPSDMSLEQKIAQLIHIDIPDLELSDSTREHFRRFEYNGVILFAKNVANREQVVKLVNDLSDLCQTPPLLSVDQEGGLVDRFRFAEMNTSPGPMALAATGSPEQTLRAHEIMGKELASLGISIDFAPCLDVNSNPNNPIIGARSFGADPETVSVHGVSALRGLQMGGVAACGKHFPGHGDTDKDSHIDLPSVTRSREDLEVLELAPFRRAIESGLDAIMTAHVTFPALDPTPGLPATLSGPILTQLLREDLEFQGVIFTDSMAMHSIAQRFGVGEAAVMAFSAGADVILACGPFENHIACVEALIAAVQEGRLSEERVNASLERIFALKAKYCRRPQAVPGYPIIDHHQNMTQISQRSVTVLSGSELLPVRGNVLVCLPDMLPQTPLGEVERAVSLAEILKQVNRDPDTSFEEVRYHLHASGESCREISDKATSYDEVIVCVYSRDRLPDGQRLLVENLLRDNVTPIVVSFSTPYLFSALPEEIPVKLITYSYTPLSLLGLSHVLLGNTLAQGRCPVPLDFRLLSTS